MSEFRSLHLDERILTALENKGYNTPTPIQLQSIPHILEGKDLFGIAQTGTGKTAAFSLPILHNLSKSNVVVRYGNVRCLILTPTRELATQIAENIELYGKELKLKYAVIFGGVNDKPQIQKLAQGVDIVIATPGRLLDLMTQGYIQYRQLEMLVLDEADRMLDMGFIDDVRKIIARLPQKRQTLFFSATISPDIAKLADAILLEPIKVEVTPPSSTVDRIDQKVILVNRADKIELLKSILQQEETQHSLVFSQTKHGANKILQHLIGSGIKAAVIHGNRSQPARQKALDDFRSGNVKVLIATDIAARGIDVAGITHVINYDIPQDPHNYVHRIGRTARAGRSGVAISFCDSAEEELLQTVEKTIKMKIPTEENSNFNRSSGSRDSGNRSSNDRRYDRDRSQRRSSDSDDRRGYDSDSRRRSHDSDDRQPPRHRDSERNNDRHNDRLRRRDENDVRGDRRGGERDGRRSDRFADGGNRRNDDRRGGRSSSGIPNFNNSNDQRNDDRNGKSSFRRSLFGKDLFGEGKSGNASFSGRVKSLFGFGGAKSDDKKPSHRRPSDGARSGARNDDSRRFSSGNRSRPSSGRPSGSRGGGGSSQGGGGRRFS